MTAILTAIVALSGLALWLLKRHFSLPATIARKEKKLNQIMEKIEDALRNHDIARYTFLDYRRIELSDEIGILREQSNNPD